MNKKELEKYIIDENMSIIDTLKAIDAGGKGCVFVCRDGRLLAAVSDGDVRRYIIANKDLSTPIRKVANYTPVYVTEGSGQDCQQLMKSKGIRALPVVNRQQHIVDIQFMYEGGKVQRHELGLSVVIMAGGKGTRLYPYTHVLPKPLIPIGELPIIEHIINEFCAYNCMDYHLIVNHKKNMIKAYFNELEGKKYSVRYYDERIPLGTGGGLSLLKGVLDTTFILTNCDVIITADFADMYKQHIKQKNLITMICCKKKITIPYGIVKADCSGAVESMTEKPQMTFLTNTGVYFAEPRVIEELQDNVSTGFPDIIEKYRKQGERIGVCSIEDEEWLDMGQPEELERMRIKMSERSNM